MATKTILNLIRVCVARYSWTLRGAAIENHIKYKRLRCSCGDVIAGGLTGTDLLEEPRITDPRLFLNLALFRNGLTTLNPNLNVAISGGVTGYASSDRRA